MSNNLDSRGLDALTGAIYFVVGRGTEGGPASYRLSVAGVSQSEWGQLGSVMQNSGYTLGTIQVDLGQRGAWPLGATEKRRLREGETTYVDALIAESSAYAVHHGLAYSANHVQLRADLLTHGNGQGHRTSITFIDTDTRDSINTWASSTEGKQWIHRNIDYAQVRNATRIAVDLLDKHPHAISEGRRFETISVIAKTANQYPGFLKDFEQVLRDGGDYGDITRKADELHARNGAYDGHKARFIAEKYRVSYEDPAKQAAMDNAHAKVSNPGFDPSMEAIDPDIQVALSAIGQRSGVIDTAVANIQHNLNQLGITDARGQPLVVDGNPGGPSSHTNEAIAAFQERFGLDGQRSNAELLTATQVALNNPIRNLDQTMRDLLPPSLQPHVPRMVDGMPDYLLSGRETAQRAPVEPTSQHASRNAPTHSTPPPQPVESATLPPLPKVELQQGDRGAAVLALQEHLRMIGTTDRAGRALTPDRDYGERTKEAVEQFQLWTGRETTGIADQDTLQALETQAQFAVRQRAQGVVAGDHLADNLQPAPLTLADAALEADRHLSSSDQTVRTALPSEASPTVTGHNMPGLPPFSHPNHPQHALYADVQQRFGAKGIELSEAQLSDLTRQVHAAGYVPGWQGDVTVYNDKAVVGSFQIGSRMASIDTTAPAPSVQDTMQGFQADQQDRAQAMGLLNQQQGMAQEHGHGWGR